MKNTALYLSLGAIALQSVFTAAHASESNCSENSSTLVASLPPQQLALIYSPLFSHSATTATAPSGTDSIGSSKDQNKSVPTKHKGKACNPTHWSLQTRGAAFYPLKSQIRKVYGDGPYKTLELESSYSLARNLWARCDQLLLWENVAWTAKNGKSIGFGYYTRMNLVPITMGLEYQVNFARYFDFYFGIGPSYSFLRIENFDGFMSTHHKRNQFGFTTKTGFRLTFLKHLFFDVFADYYYTSFRKIRHDPIQNLDNTYSAFYVGGGFGGKW
ncbi:MAG: hypothetical protein JSS60_05715 [Verrucomicrobia bacterium]|nr:hypothetical protein [Verrucomicrobiota bacterium]